MNIIFGKYQLNICQFSDSGSINNSHKLTYSRFNLVFGLGSTKIQWLLASIGGNRTLKISAFLNKYSIINREKIISKNCFRNYFQFVGMDLKHIRIQQKSRTKQFLTAFKRPITKKSPIRFKNKRKKLV